TLQYGVYASKFPFGVRTLWTLVNRNEYPVAGEQLTVASSDGVRWFDVWNGKELRPQNGRLSFPIEAQGFAAILTAPSVDETFLARMSKLTATPLASLSREWRSIPQSLVEIAPTKRLREAPAGMVRIPAGEFEFEVHGVEIEGENSDG